MDAKEFNQQYESILAEPLAKIGFHAHGQSLLCIKDETVFALLRRLPKGSGFLRETHFVVYIRHSFLRTLEKEPAERPLTEPTSIRLNFACLSCRGSYRGSGIITRVTSASGNMTR